jgi:PAS domain S-box-containing protein
LAVAEALAAHAGAVVERKRADVRQAAALARQSAALGVARAEARAVLDATAEAMILVDPDRRVRLVNRAFVEGFGIEPGEVLGHDFRDLAPLVARVFADPAGFGRLVAGTAADPARRFSADVRQRWPQARDLVLTTVPVSGPDGRALGRLYVFRDVTQEREVARLQEERQHALEGELARGAQLQADLLPRGTPVFAGFDFAARCVPARAVGGDFFDWHQATPGVLTLTLGDVMGKGLPAALLMATVRAALEAVDRRSPPARALEALAAATARDLEKAGAFVTLFHARADATTRRVEYADAGHGLVFVRRAGGAVEGLPARGLPLGVLPGQRYPAGELTMAPGDALVIYSDGLLDARPDLQETPSSLAARLDGATSALAIVERLVALTESAEPLLDDLTVVALRCRDDAP